MRKRILLDKVSEFPDESAQVVDSGGTSIVVARVGQEFCAVLNKRPHLGLPLTANKVEGKTITCPFHGSQFDMCTGENIDWLRGVGGMKMPEWSRHLLAMGKQPAPVQTFLISVEGGEVFVEI